MTTTIRVSEKQWHWVKSHPGLEFSAILRAKINQMMLDEDTPKPSPMALKVQEMRQKGLTDGEIAVQIDRMRRADGAVS